MSDDHSDGDAAEGEVTVVQCKNRKRKGSIIWAPARTPARQPSYSPCPHIYFKNQKQIINRLGISREEHFKLLAKSNPTPWMKMNANGQELVKYRRRPISARTEQLAVPRLGLVRAQVEEYKHKLSPEMLARLEKILAEALFISPEEIRKFMESKKKKKKKKKKVPLVEQTSEEFVKEMLSKIADRAAEIVESRPPPMTHRLEVMMAAIVRRLAEFSGIEPPSPDCTGVLSRALVVVAEKLAGWVQKTACEAEELPEEPPPPPESQAMELLNALFASAMYNPCGLVAGGKKKRPLKKRKKKKKRTATEDEPVKATLPAATTHACKCSCICDQAPKKKRGKKKGKGKKRGKKGGKKSRGDDDEDGGGEGIKKKEARGSRRPKGPKRGNRNDTEAEEDDGDESVSGESDESVSGESDESVSGESDENVSGESDENVSAENDGNVAEGSDEVVDEEPIREEVTEGTERRNRDRERTNNTERRNRDREGTNNKESRNRDREGTNNKERRNRDREGTNNKERRNRDREGTNNKERRNRDREGTNNKERRNRDREELNRGGPVQEAQDNFSFGRKQESGLRGKGSKKNPASRSKNKAREVSSRQSLSSRKSDNAGVSKTSAGGGSAQVASQKSLPNTTRTDSRLGNSRMSVFHSAMSLQSVNRVRSNVLENIESRNQSEDRTMERPEDLSEETKVNTTFETPDETLEQPPPVVPPVMAEPDVAPEARIGGALAVEDAVEPVINQDEDDDRGGDQGQDRDGVEDNTINTLATEVADEALTDAALAANGMTFESILQQLAYMIEETPESDKTDRRVKLMKTLEGKFAKLVEKDRNAENVEEIDEIVASVADKVAAWMDGVIRSAESRISMLSDRKEVVEAYLAQPTENGTLVIQSVHSMSQGTTRTPVQSRDVREWAQWIVGVVDVAEDWAGWITKTVAAAEEKAMMKRGEALTSQGEVRKLTRAEWNQWKDDVKKGVIDFRTRKKKISEDAYEWDKRTRDRGIVSTNRKVKVLPTSTEVMREEREQRVTQMDVPSAGGVSGTQSSARSSK